LEKSDAERYFKEHAPFLEGKGKGGKRAPQFWKRKMSTIRRGAWKKSFTSNEEGSPRGGGRKGMSGRKRNKIELNGSRNGMTAVNIQEKNS